MSWRLTLRVCLPCVAGLALVVPGAARQSLNGLPLSALGLLALTGVLYAALALPSAGQPIERWLVLGFGIVVGLKVVAGGIAPPLGLQASYWARSTPEGAPERSTDYRWLTGATRIDGTLDLKGEDFAVHFFNDAARFNFGPDAQPGRDQLPFSVRWQGFLVVPSDGERQFVSQSTGTAKVWIDETALAGVAARVHLLAGLHALRVEYTRPEARVPRLLLTWERVPGGRLVTLGGDDVRWKANRSGAEPSGALGVVADWGVAALIGAWVCLGLVAARRMNQVWRAALGAVPLVFLLHGVLGEAPLAGRATILSGLDDWLIYESSARDILVNGPLMDAGQGHAAPFYGQPLYPYVLAVAHWLSGESLFGPLALQFAALGGVLVGTAVLARRAFGSRLDGLVALAWLWVLLQVEGEHFKVARQLFNENLYMPLVMASLVAVVSLARRRQPPAGWRAVLVGGLLGLTAISRSPFLLFVPFGLLVLLVAWRRDAASACLKALAIVAGVLLVVAPVTARNWVVSGQVVPISSSGGASLLEFHRPPPGLIDPASLQNHPLFEALHLDTQTRTVLAFVRTDPAGYLRTLLPLGAHSLGLQGRSDPGIYWPLFATVLVYLAAFGLRQTRQLHVWPLHAFVATHLLVLMLFEADTYGYRLVMPMYAPMLAVAAQVPLAALRSVFAQRRSSVLARDQPGANGFATIGWAALATAALAWQARSLVDSWPQRETNLHGLGGPAAQAALVADQVGADAIFVASIDGTPRHFGGGSLTGLRYPWFKWFDPSRSLPLPSSSGSGVYMLSELSEHSLPGDLVGCLGPPEGNDLRVIGGDRAFQQCAGQLVAGSAASVSFDGVARIDALRVPETVVAGDHIDSQMVWQPLVAHPEPQQVSLQLDDPQAGDGTLWGNGTLDLYPASQWDPTQPVLSRLAVATDPTAIPQPYRLTVGIGPTRPNTARATAQWQGSRTERVPVRTVALSPGSMPLDQALPADMRAVEGPPLVGGGLQLIGARSLPAEAAIGSPLRLGLLWQATQDAPRATRLELRLLRGNGEVIQESILPLLGGRVVPSALHAGNIVRDEQTLVVNPRVPPESLVLEAQLLDAEGAALAEPAARLGSITMSGRAHAFDSSPTAGPDVIFGGDMQLVSSQLEPAQARADDNVTVKLHWRSVAEMARAYKVFVHVLDPASQTVVAQRDAEPQSGRAPTTGWVPGETIDDEYAISLPVDLQAGDYPVEVGVYDARTGSRLALPSGDTRVILNARLHVP